MSVVVLREKFRSERSVIIQVYNAHETGLLWKAVPENTQANKKDSSVPGRKLNKERLTALVCAMQTVLIA
jgi:hypothetical protein